MRVGSRLPDPGIRILKQVHERIQAVRLTDHHGAVTGLGIWELEGKNLLVIGLGGVGIEVARRAHAPECVCALHGLTFDDVDAVSITRGGVTRTGRKSR